jgi:hypothetical protein
MRRALAVEEANNIGPAWLWLDLLLVAANRRCANNSDNTWVRAWRSAANGRILRLPRMNWPGPQSHNEIWKATAAACHGSGSSPAH